MIQVVVFDFDGTLVNSNAIKRQSFYEAVAGVPGASAVLDELFADCFKGDRYTLLTEMCHRLSPKRGREVAQLEGRKIAATYSELCREKIGTCAEIPGALLVLKALREREIGAYIVSATPEVDLQPIVSDRNLDQYFKGVFGTPISKSLHLENILAIEGINPTDLAVVGDGDDDLAAATQLGCQFVGISNFDDSSLPSSAWAINDLYSLPVILLEN